MRTGKSISELAIEIQRQADAKKDYLADTRKVAMTDTADLEIANGNGHTHHAGISSLAHRQIGTHLGIHAKYYDKMLAESPQLLATNVNHWFNAAPTKRLIRTLDGDARAFLSDRYQRIDNIHIAETVLPVLAETPGIEIVSTDITPSKLYIKAVTHAVRAEVHSRRVGDIVEAGVCITNSEVGLGAINVDPFFNFLACLNGMIRKKDGLRRAHLGTKIEEDELESLLADDTKTAADKLLLLKVRDVLRAAMDEARFREAVNLMEGATQERISGDPVAAVEVLSNTFDMNETERTSVLKHLIEGGDLSRYGVMNAVTRTAEDVIDYDRASDFEAIGGRILDLPRRQWEEIAQAA